MRVPYADNIMTLECAIVYTGLYEKYNRPCEALLPYNAPLPEAWTAMLTSEVASARLLVEVEVILQAELNEQCSLLEAAGWSSVPNDDGNVIYGASDGKLSIVTVAAMKQEKIVWTVIASNREESVHASGPNVLKAVSRLVKRSSAMGAEASHTVATFALRVAIVARTRAEAAILSREHNLKMLLN